MSKELTTTTYDYGELAGQGFQDIDPGTLSIPLILLLQALSPQTEDGHKAGSYYDTLSEESFSSFSFIPCHWEEKWFEWVPRSQGGGLVETHSSNSPLVQDMIRENNNSRIPPKGADGKTRFVMDNGHELVETHNLYVLLFDAEGQSDGYAVMPFNKTKIKPFNTWRSKLVRAQGKKRFPIFALQCVADVVEKKGTEGKYYVPAIKPAVDNNWISSLMPPSSDLFQEARKFSESVTKGAVEADYSKAATVEDDEVPF